MIFRTSAFAVIGIKTLQINVPENVLCSQIIREYMLTVSGFKTQLQRLDRLSKTWIN